MRFAVRDSDGLTLIEIIAAITVLGILTGVLAQAVAFWNALGEKSRQVLQRQNELQSALNSILEGSGSRSGLLVAESFTVSGSPDPCGLGDDDQMTTLTFTLPDDTVVTYRYAAAEGKLYKRIDGESESDLLSSLTCFSAKEGSDGKIVLLRLRATVKGVGGPRLVELATQVKPRNLTH